MYIISKYKDYYDGVAGSVGVDKTIVYKRETTTIDDKEQIPTIFRETNWRDMMDNDFLNISSHYKISKEHNKKYKDIDHFVIGFCGKFYLGWKVFEDVGLYKSHKFFITYDHNYIESITETRGWGRNNKKLLDRCSNILEYNDIELFRFYNCPVFIYDISFTENYARGVRTFIINPKLSDYEFYKVIDSFQTHQMIQSFLSGVLTNNEKDIIEIEDKFKITQHGFDKWSFKKPPENKK